LTVMTTLMFWGILSLYGPQVFAYVRLQVGVDQIAADVAALRADVLEWRSAEGVLEDRDGYSYALTPVSRSLPLITATFYLRRTEAGANCTATNVIPMFEGSRHIPRAGRMVTEMVQIGTDWTVVEIQAEVPRALSNGRAVMWLVVDYVCQEGVVRDQTSPVVFEFTE